MIRLWEPVIGHYFSRDIEWWFYNGLLGRHKYCQFPYRFIVTDRTWYLSGIREVHINRL